MKNLAGNLEILSSAEINKIHQASLEILQKTGLEVENKEMLQFFKDRGAQVDMEKATVYLPESMVEEAVETAPSRVVLYSRDGNNDLDLGGNRVHIGTGGTAVKVFDLDGNRRDARAADVARIAGLVENLPNIDFFVVSTYPVNFPRERADEVRFFNSLCYTNKHVMGGVYTLGGIKKVIDFAVELAGSEEELAEKPFISMITSIMSPLKMEKEYTGYMRYIIEHGVPIVAPPAPIAGATSPLTMAGTLAQMNAEALFGIVASQLIKPGAKVLYGIVPTTMDLRTSGFRFGSIEAGVMNAAGAQLARYYNLPLYNTAGVSDSRVPDIEAGYEKMGNILLSALTGANFIHDAAGLLDTGLSVAYEQYVIDNEIIGMVKKVLRGIEVSEEKLALEDIAEVGPGGNFLTAATTLKYMKTELYEQDLYEPDRWEEWQKKGEADTRERAKKITADILNGKPGLCIDEDILEDRDWPIIGEETK